MHVPHVRLQALGRLAGIADGPAAGVDLVPQRVFHRRLVHAAPALHQAQVLLAVLLADELVGEAELLRELVHDHVVGARLEHRLDHLLAPLE
ncbi:hypothetical protein D3C83_83440 [compost metagenome]